MKDYKLEQDVVSFQQAIDLCTLGYDEPTLCAYDIDDQQLYLCQLTVGGLYMPHKDIYAPTHSQVFRWFREKYGLLGCIDGLSGRYYYNIRSWKNIDHHHYFTTYEEAENACIDKLIEIAKQQDK